MSKDTDLIQQIGEVVDQKIASRLEPIETRLGGIETRVGSIETRLGRVEKEQKKQGKALKSVKSTLDVAARLFNSEDMHLRKRVKRIETHLRLEPIE